MNTVWHAQVAIKKIKSVKLQIYWRCNPELRCDSIRFGRGLVFQTDVFADPERRVISVIPHTYAIGCSLHRGANGGIDHVPALRPAHSRDDFLFRAADYRRQDGPDEIVRGGQPRRAVGGMRCDAAPDTLTDSSSPPRRRPAPAGRGP